MMSIPVAQNEVLLLYCKHTFMRRLVLCESVSVPSHLPRVSYASGVRKLGAMDERRVDSPHLYASAVGRTVLL